MASLCISLVEDARDNKYSRKAFFAVSLVAFCLLIGALLGMLKASHITAMAYWIVGFSYSMVGLIYTVLLWAKGGDERGSAPLAGLTIFIFFFLMILSTAGYIWNHESIPTHSLPWWAR